MTSWNQIVREHGPPTYRAAWRILQHAQDCEDVLQEVFIEAHDVFLRGEISHPRTFLNRLVAYRRGAKNAAIVAAIMYSIIGAISFAISKLLNVSLVVVVGGTFGIFCAVLYPTFFFSILWSRASRGDVLIDCGPHPSEKRFLAMSAVMLIAAVGFLVSYRETAGVLIAVFLLTFMSFFLVAATGRLQICENGVFQYGSLLRWSKIESYRWEGTTDATLMLQARTRFAFLGRGALPVAIEQKDAVDALMRKHTGKVSFA